MVVLTHVPQTAPMRNSLFRPSPQMVFLLLAIPLLWYQVTMWQKPDDLGTPLYVCGWIMLIVACLSYQLWRAIKDKRLDRQGLSIAVLLLMLCGCGYARLPARAFFQANQTQLEKWEKLPPRQVPLAQTVPGAIKLSPFQIAKSNGDTLIILWEDKDGEGFEYAYSVGFAHCPNDAGCGRADFHDYWDYTGNQISYADPPIEYYWDYLAGERSLNSVGNDWYLVTLIRRAQ